MLGKIARLIFAVKSIDPAVEKMKGLFDAREKSAGRLEREKIRYVILSMGEWDLELIEPTAPDSFINRFIERKGEGIYGVTVSTGGIEAEVATLKGNGVTFVSADPVSTPEGRVALVHPGDLYGLTLELTD
ncbi:MAG: VOC family protein [Actinobacteria bacterium]|nr:VOC family protein [Actinomycetota bacterium]